MAQSFNQVTLVGRLTKDPEMKKTSTDKVVCPFSLAVNKLYKEDTNFFDCESWNKTAEYVGKYLKKGDLVIISGRLDQQVWEKDGQKRSTIRIICENVQSLTTKKNREESDSGISEEQEITENQQIDLSEVPF